MPFLLDPIIPSEELEGCNGEIPTFAIQMTIIPSEELEGCNGLPALRGKNKRIIPSEELEGCNGKNHVLYCWYTHYTI